jgi:hypothetical protein
MLFLVSGVSDTIIPDWLLLLGEINRKGRKKRGGTQRIQLILSASLQNTLRSLRLMYSC